MNGSQINVDWVQMVMIMLTVERKNWNETQVLRSTAENHGAIDKKQI